MPHFDDASPIYLQIAEEIRTQILSGELAEGARLTSTTEYATRYRINPATANKAVSLLVDEGLVVKRRGIGMFVTQGALERLRRSRRTTYTDDVLHPALDTGLALGLSPAELGDAVATHLRTRTPKETR
ncbi:GntR family transcriptional regulator [Actinomyces sp. HMT897]|uniref:GntR family transcriptional regulator n=1 Tax=Actinomyces sp. HMT897 TaxID=2789424 RepID=UPI0019099892|nr:GntR family transcriptional regulator [Actinomyces sp. HMT897]QQO78469.1 GntR family transcriptional regulator [Actinomyces sp. HMT897]